MDDDGGARAGGAPYGAAPAVPGRGGGLLPVLTGIVAAVLAGLLAAVLGTMLHGQLLYVGRTPVPWGAVLALVLAGALCTLAALYAERVWVAGAAGVVAYAAVAAVSLDGINRLIVGAGRFDVLPGPALAGVIWTYGIVVATLVALVLAARTLRGAPRR